jgi:beta-galactosidase/beta-glucuronidase
LRFDEWYKPNLDDQNWEEILTTQPFYVQGNHIDQQGYPYQGAIWYRLDVDISKNATNTPTWLYGPAVETEALVWVNGKFVGHRPYLEAYYRPSPIDLDVSKALKPGSNQITMRLHTNYQPARMAAGLVSRLFIYGPSISSRKGKTP